MSMIVKITISLVTILLLSGCWDRTELNDLAMITALAFDKAENNQIQTTVQISIPQSQGGGMMGGGSGSTPKTVTQSEKGYDVTDALSKLQRKVSRKLFWGQCKVFIFGEEVAKAGIREHFDFLLRHPKTRERAYLFVASGKASEALDLSPPSERSSAEVLRKLTELKIGVRVTVEQFSMMLKGDSQAAALPLVNILPPPPSASNPNQTIPFIFGTAVFKKDKMVGDISEKDTRGVLWLKNEIKEYTITFKNEKGEGLVSLNPVKADVKLLPKIKGDKWVMTVKVKTVGDIVQNATLLNPMNQDLLRILNKAYVKDVTTRIQTALRKVQHELKTDIFNFASEFHRKYPKHWERSKDRWDEIFPKVEVNIKVNARILRPGLINTPGGMPAEETIRH